jgi:hypothetical protein
MGYLKRNTKRIAIDLAGYLLILVGIIISPVPGPGGIPVMIAGLGLLSINNKWAARLRDTILDNGGKLVKIAFPPNPLVQWLYDLLVVLLLAIVTILALKHAAIWEMSVAIGLFFFSIFVAAMNRDRYVALKRKRK